MILGLKGTMGDYKLVQMWGQTTTTAEVSQFVRRQGLQSLQLHWLITTINNHSRQH